MTVTVADHIRWMGQMSQGARYGATAGDSFYQGSYDYATSRPYPNGLPVVPGGMSDCEAGKRMIDKARRDSAQHTRHIEFEMMQGNGAVFASDDVRDLIEITRRVYNVRN